jgi:glycosyltransferase involved in cell wall biosynthesis
MKILVLNYEYPPLGGGAAPVSRDLSTQLAHRGHDVTVVTMGYQDLPAYEEAQKVKVYRLKCLRSKKNSCMPWEQYTYLFAVRRFMKEHMKTHVYDVCHTHFVIPTGEAALWVAGKFGLPYVITAHGSDVEGHNHKKYMKIMHKLLRYSWRKIVNCSEGVIAPSVYLQNLMKAGYAKGKYIFIPNGLDTAKYSQFAERRNKEKNILLMGRLQRHKNVQTILRAIARIDLSGWMVDVLGDGPYRKELEKLVSELGLVDCVKFYGWIDNGSIEQLYYLKRASVYITASYFENCPMAVIETIAAGCYPLLSDIPAHRQLVPEDEYYFEADDVQGLAHKLLTVISKADEISADRIDISKYDWERVISQYEEVLCLASERRV